MHEKQVTGSGWLERGPLRGFLEAAPDAIVVLLRASPPRRYSPSDLTLAEELARRISTAIDNARLYREAQDAIRARDEFLQIASHELKTPLTSLQLQLDRLSRALATGGARAEGVSEKLDKATRQAARLSGLVERLLDVSRITAGRIVLDLEDFDLVELLRELAERFREVATASEVELVVDLRGPICGRWDRLRVEQILSNLLSDAIKYGRGKPVEIAASASEGTVRVSVADRGIGIDPKAMERIFGRLERAVPLRHFGGFGLGLFIARQFAEAHGGTVLVQSQPERGSTFTVVLPCDATAVPSAPSRPEEQSS